MHSGGNSNSQGSQSSPRWPMPGHDPSQRANASLGGGPSPPLQSRWEVDLNEKISTSPAVAGNRVYVGTYSGKLNAITADDGLRRWAKETVGEITPPVVAAGTVYVGSRRPARETPQEWEIVAINALTGEDRWQINTNDANWVPVSAPVVADDTLFIGGRTLENDGILVAIDATTGTIQWEQRTEWPVSATPVVVDSTVYYGTEDCLLRAVDAETGAPQWEFKPHRGVTNTVAVVDDTVFVGSGGRHDDDARLKAVDATTGDQLWECELYNRLESPVVAGETVYIVDGWTLKAIDIETGQQKWDYNVHPTAMTSPSMDSGHIYVGLRTRRTFTDAQTGLVVVSAETGEKLSQFDMAGSVTPPVVASETIYCGTDAGMFYALTAADSSM